MYIKVMFEGDFGHYTYWLPEEYIDEANLYDYILVNAGEKLKLASIVEMGATKPTFMVRCVSAHFPANITNKLLHSGKILEILV